MDVIRRGITMATQGAHETENTDAVTNKNRMQTRSTRVALGYIENKGHQDRSHVAANNEIVKKEGSRPKTTNTITKQESKKDIKIESKAFVKPRPVTAATSKVPTKATQSKQQNISEHDKNELQAAQLETTDKITSSHSMTALSIMDTSTEVEDIDANDTDNPQLVSEYVNDIYLYMMHLEELHAIKPNFLQRDGQDITPKMRAILVDWLCQVHHRFHLLQETLFLTISIIDRYLQKTNVTKPKLQLVGVTAMLIASKYEEMYITEVSDYVYITDNAYTKADIRNMEISILTALDFRLGKPLCLHFLRRNSKAGKVDARKHTLAKYLMELTIVEYDFCHLCPSLIAAASLALSMRLLDGSLWTQTLAHYSHYTFERLFPVMRKLARVVLKLDKSKLTAIKLKHQSSKLMKISLIPQLSGDVIYKIGS